MQNNKITIFGASGAAGKLGVDYALSQGYLVTAFVRNKSKLNRQHPNLKIIEAPLCDVGAVEDAVDGALAVISFLGPQGKIKNSLLSEGVKAIVKAMEKKHTKRLIALGTRNIRASEDGVDLRFTIMVSLLKLLARKTYQEVINMGSHIMVSSLDWTIIRVPWLNDKPLSGRIRLGYYGDKQNMTLSRADLAKCFIDQINDKKFLHKLPALSNY